MEPRRRLFLCAAGVISPVESEKRAEAGIGVHAIIPTAMRNTLSRLLSLSAIVCFALSSAPARAADAVSATHEVNGLEHTWTNISATVTKNNKIGGDGLYFVAGSEGDISVSKMIQNTGISRPVYNSLLNTLANTHCAEIDAHGVKGTHIKIISPTLLEHLSQN